MCFCCCESRKALLIYSIVISGLAFIFGIVVIAEFGSKTDVYKALINQIEGLEKCGKKCSSSSSFRWYLDLNFKKTKKRKLASGRDEYEFAKDVLDYESLIRISSLTYNDLEKNSYGLIKSLKGIEMGLGIILFIFPLIFLCAEIAYLIFVCGIRETQVLSLKTYKIFNIIKLVTYILSIIFIFLAVLYGTLIIVALAQYIKLVDFIDSCVIGMIIDIVFGYYSFWYYIILACALGKERKLFIDVGNEASPGPKAEYDVKGNPIQKTVIVQPVIGVIPQVAGQSIVNMNIPFQPINQTGQQKSTMAPIETQRKGQRKGEEELETDRKLNLNRNIDGKIKK